MHVAEVGVPDPDDDDGHGEVGGLDDGLPGVGHVCDDAVRQDQQDEVLLEDKGYKNDQSVLPFFRRISKCQSVQTIFTSVLKVSEKQPKLTVNQPSRLKTWYVIIFVIFLSYF